MSFKKKDAYTSSKMSGTNNLLKAKYHVRLSLAIFEDNCSNKT